MGAGRAAHGARGARSLLAVLLATACQALPSDGSGFGSVPDLTTTTGAGSTGASSGGSGGTTSSGGGSASTSTGSDGTAGTTTTIFDLGSDADVGNGKPVGCEGKIDFLFVVSRDANMELAQAQLIKAFPKFLATTQAKFVDFDYQIMVVDGGGGWGSDWCNQECEQQGVCPVLAEYPCDLLDLVTECDQTLGASEFCRPRAVGAAVRRSAHLHSIGAALASLLV